MDQALQQNLIIQSRKHTQPEQKTHEHTFNWS